MSDFSGKIKKKTVELVEICHDLHLNIYFNIILL